MRVGAATAWCFTNVMPETSWERPAMKLLGELLLVLAIGLGWLFLLARLAQGHIEGPWRYVAWTVVGLFAVLLLRYAVNMLEGHGW